MENEVLEARKGAVKHIETLTGFDHRMADEFLFMLEQLNPGNLMKSYLEVNCFKRVNGLTWLEVYRATELSLFGY